jgi:hypothetical protein
MLNSMVSGTFPSTYRERIHFYPMIHPMGISIPAEKIVASVPPKTKLVSGSIPNSLQQYTFETESEYYAEYQRSCFAHTSRKGGWDCLRHYEIMANGCIPLFDDLENCPSGTMPHFPKQLVRDANTALIADLSQYGAYATRILDYTRRHLTTTASADSLLRTIGQPDVKRVLFLSGLNWWSQHPDYVRNGVLHGLKRRLGAECHDFPRINHMYADFEGDCSEFHGRGFSMTRLLDPALHDNALDAGVEEDIRARRYDLVVYGSVHRNAPLLDVVFASYPPSQIVGICGEDAATDDGGCPLTWFAARGAHVFRRENREN